MLFFPTVDEDVAYFRSQGYTGSINDMHYKAMGDLGYTGSLNDRIHAFLTFKYGSFYEAMRDLRNGTSVFSLISAYGINSLDPALVFDFTEDYFRTAGTDTTFDSAITHAATTNATMVDSDGLLKWRPHNLLKYSEQFDNAAWGKTLVNITASPNDPLSGFSTLSRFTTTSVSNPYLLQSNVTVVSGVNYTFEMIVKYVDTQWVRLQNQEAETVWFDLLNGVVGTQTNATGTIESLSDGFYRVAIEFDANDTSTYLLFTTSQTDGGGLEAIGSVDVQAATAYRSDLGGVVNNPDRGDSYVPTTTAARYLPRRGHHVYNGSEWVNEGLLHESDARTNLVTYSEVNEANSEWARLGSQTLSSLSSDPAGGANARLLKPVGSPSVSWIYSDIKGTGVVTSISVFAKYSGKQWMSQSNANGNTIYASFDLLNGELGTVASGYTATIENYESGWYRCTVTTPTNFNDRAIFAVSDTDGGISATESGEDGILLYGAQLEVGSTPSSYIPTAGATATRAAETLTVPAANMPYDSTSMSIQMDGLMTYADESNIANVQFLWWNRDGNTRIYHWLNTVNVAEGKVTFAQEAENVVDNTVEDNPGSYSPDINVPFNIASRHGSTFINGAVDGTALTANTTPTALPYLQATDFQLGYDYMGTIGKLRVWSDDIGDTGIEEAST